MDGLRVVRNITASSNIKSNALGNDEVSDESGRKIGDSSQGSVGDPELFDFQIAPNGKALQNEPEKRLRNFSLTQQTHSIVKRTQ